MVGGGGGADEGEEVHGGLGMSEKYKGRTNGGMEGEGSLLYIKFCYHRAVEMGGDDDAGKEKVHSSS